MITESIDYFTLIKDIGFPIAVAWFVITKASGFANKLVEAHVGFIAALGASQAQLERGQDTTNDRLSIIHHLLTAKDSAA